MSGPADCPAGVCVTCSDQAVPMTVLRLVEPDLAMAGAGDVAEEVSVALVDAAVGDTVLVHAKEAIAVIAKGGGDGQA
ncbi:HypC/HybG/HupF family hydrogenase formation chaperone [Streptosporangium minutum]|uniref:Hydrogenase assembly protein HupF n=1 Tax=Streptosporangium minutum TaxID=569862 RepID=A0A243RYU6_9ACTN|nr:HypC/HybG/HupF family hydrogenase formation chaperone [Streptosporangium minutum]OUC99693.1 hydrogenase assembly protein HupF [Streptosporangium minutum]